MRHASKQYNSDGFLKLPLHPDFSYPIPKSLFFR